MSLTLEKSAQQDIWRSIILARLISTWGLPDTRIVSKHKDYTFPHEVYSFPGPPEGTVHRFATFGLSLNQYDLGHNQGLAELLLVLPRDLAGISSQEAMHVLLDVAAYALREHIHLGRRQTIPTVETLPRDWTMSSLILDEPVCEPEDMAAFHVGSLHIDLVWVIPAHREEAALAVAHGFPAFDEYVTSRKISLLNPRRENMLKE
jgi:hypothetical protein